MAGGNMAGTAGRVQRVQMKPLQMKKPIRGSGSACFGTGLVWTGFRKWRFLAGER